MSNVHPPESPKGTVNKPGVNPAVTSSGRRVECENYRLKHWLT